MQDKCLREVVNQIAKKGDPVILAGEASAGKSTVIASLAFSKDVQNLLAIREYGSSPVNAVVTDFSEIPEDCLIVTGTLRRWTASDLADDNELLGKVVCSAFRKTQTKCWGDYCNNLEKELNKELAYSECGTLAYLLRNTNKSDRERLLKDMESLPIDEISFLYEEAFEGNGRPMSGLDLFFSQLLSESEVCKTSIRCFWWTVIELVNKSCELLCRKLDEYGLILHSSDGGMVFAVALDKSAMTEDSRRELVDLLLNPAYSGRCLLEDTTLIFRGWEGLFEVDNTDFFTVMEKGGEKVHCLRLVDTVGFPCTVGGLADKVSGIVDSLARYHSNKVVFVGDASNPYQVKEVLRWFLMDTNRDVSVYLLYTHWDYLLIHAGMKAGLAIDSPDYEDMIYGVLDTVLESLSDTTRAMVGEALSFNSAKRKPVFVGTYHAALFAGITELETVLLDANISYPGAWDALMADMVVRAGHPVKHRVKDLEKCCTVTVRKQSQSSCLYQNLIECKKKRLRPATIRDCINEWRYFGKECKVCVEIDNGGYENVTTVFVREIRNYFIALLSNADISDCSGILVDGGCAEEFKEDLMDYFRWNQNLGRKAAEFIGDDACQWYQLCDLGPVCLGDFFRNMLQFVQENYFPGRNTECTAESKECLNEAVNACICDFINERCIVVK